MINFQEGEKVVCISDDFPKQYTTNADKSDIGVQADLHPVKSEVLVISEILGNYLNFVKYNSPDNIRWFHYKKFAPLDSDFFSEKSENIVTIAS